MTAPLVETKTSVVFETATIADSLKKAEACAPRINASDESFGSYAGIVLSIRAGHPVTVRSTNGAIFYEEWVECLEMTGPDADWRIPVSRFTGVIGALPMGTGRTVELTADGMELHLKSGRTKGKVRMISMAGYPLWERYSEEATVVVPSMGQRISQVSWACHKDAEPFNGLFFDGHSIIATDSKRAAVIPLSIPTLVGRATTVPLKVLGPVIRHAGDVRFGITDNFVTISPDEYTQIRCSVFANNIPDPKVFLGLRMSHQIELDKDLLIDTVKRMLNITKGTKEVPVVKMLLGMGHLLLRIEGSKDGEYIEDAIALPGQADHLPITLLFVPNVLMEAIGKAPDEKVVVNYNGNGQKNNVVSVDGGGGYMSYFVQWKEMGKSNDEQ